MGLLAQVDVGVGVSTRTRSAGVGRRDSGAGVGVGVATSAVQAASTSAPRTNRTDEAKDPHIAGIVADRSFEDSETTVRV